MIMAEQNQRIFAVCAFAVLLVVFVTGLAPLHFEFPGSGMEGSWIWASVYAGLNRFAYGTQFVFTNGPLFPLYHREYAGDATPYYAFGRFAVALYLTWGFTRLSIGGGGWSWTAVVVASILLFPVLPFLPNESPLIALTVLTVLLVLARKGGWVSLAFGVILSAALGLAKVSFIPFHLGAFMLVDIALLSRRRIPLSLIGYAIVSFALFVAAGQSPGDFFPFLTGSWEMMSGYSAGLSLDGPLLELVAWLAISALILAALIVRRGDEPAIDKWLRVLLFVGLIYISIKAGFVRHDRHSAAGWGLLLLWLLLLGLPGTLPGWRPRTLIASYALPVAALVVGLILVRPMLLERALPQARDALLEQVASAQHLASDPNGWLEQLRNRENAAAAAIAAAEPLPRLAGRVDAIANVQSRILAARQTYWPRPTIQENMTTTPALTARNRAFFAGPDAPDHLLFAPGATDSRHPASVEGALWPLFIAEYAPAARTGDILVLDRRARPLSVSLVEQARTNTTFGADISLPTEGPLFLRLDIREALLGKLVGLAYKPPLVHLVMTYADGSNERLRLIPGMIADGMVVSPTISTIDQYIALATGAPIAAPVPTAIRVETDGAWAYRPEITAIVEQLRVGASAQD